MCADRSEVYGSDCRHLSGGIKLQRGWPVGRVLNGSLLPRVVFELLQFFGQFFGLLAKVGQAIRKSGDIRLAGGGRRLRRRGRRDGSCPGRRGTSYFGE